METGLVRNAEFTAVKPMGSSEERILGREKSPGYERTPGRAEYLLVVYPQGDLLDKLMEEQQQFSSDYGLQMTVRNKPHITVAVFQAGEEMEDTLIRWIQRICTQHK